ncbi:DNA-directed RNA polymerase subunit beta [Candidatus Nomurabacteria bacterium RIFCSPHIGHO2_01_FULL_39_220]|uniref:DNA-directed RNA polymerase subunit beta n=1 Tax=Candidatus Nomurabacteria bacterium RIFCSPLOWO2_02_FULL_40_67 TaxID=1801787 RepID=A0A1F6Y7I2_9BACT|nr:MAG: DNA-directed RNA polymerase subunit beta [Parcubacteria group bacterium GW2011_GWA2_40_37]KKS10920.1 MAG: DNA-directed RNA polymerase subunit beta [Parcubacteria group bacterium GW2011_GWB1_41_5]OGI61968.1 MAG: DNA-directed RNA polymerase subunit beta [Candidatus Nomurabacteria bacterium RBG_16_40_11]OGI70701.1 MAG: DNA-directed RNA polymerase subunit beta [Candidatus Nomurabacteria bacterium RIFCSPHIGHO2_01_FULL_39_220]OGI72917.1 MAG: DNA-directed RNA polymerase subunit beta [Candidatu
MHTIALRPKKYFSRYKKPLVEFPNLIEAQLKSFEWLVGTGIGEVFKEFSPILDYSTKKFQLEFASFSLSESAYNENHAKINKLSYQGLLKARVKLTNKILGTVKEQEIFMSELPLMTSHGTFIINGVERVIVPQLARSFGVFFTESESKGNRYFGAKIIPARGVWIEIESESDGGIYIRIDKKRKFPATALLRAMGYETNEAILKAFSSKSPLNSVFEKTIKNCLSKDGVKSLNDSYIEIYKRLRDGDMATAENAKEFINSLFIPERYDLSPVGRFRFNQRFAKPMDEAALAHRTISKEDLVTVIAHIILLNNTPGSKSDDIDHLGQRRVRFVGEILQQKVRTGMMQIKRNIQDRMSIIDVDTAMPINIINQRPLQARIKEFFTTNQLSQFMGQENVLAETEHLRLLSALGPGGLTRERAGLEVRDVHPSHYGRVCPIHTPEGPNIGLILHLATYAKINEFGIIETPYIKVAKGKITGEIVYLNALEEEKYNIAHAATPYDEHWRITEEKVEARIKTEPGAIFKEEVDFIDVSPNQAFSIATSMIPFLEHNNANRALMGSNMQKQAVPCVLPEAPLVSTGVEELAARDSGRLIIAIESGVVSYLDARKIVVKSTKSEKNSENIYNLINFMRNNNFAIFHQRPLVNIGDKVKKGDVLADTSSTMGGQISLGQNIFVAFLSWSGSTYEDAIIVSERLVKKSKFTSVYLEEFTCVVRDTKLGPEITTRDISNVGELKLKDLDEDGIVRIGAEVRENDILVGKITPKGETELTPEERLLRSIFAEKARDVKDTSLRVEHGKRGRIIGVKIFSRDLGHTLEAGIIKKIMIEVAQIRNISVGDKLSGRHGNKGIISTILPEEDMPYMADGTPVDIILSPLGVPSRMNLGQILEMHLGMAANSLGYQAVVPPFLGAKHEEIKEELTKAGLPPSGKLKLFDGRTGEAFEQAVAVGYMYMLKLHHMVEDKIHMRSIGPYSLITQQPLGGKAQGGGQRFGEMEVWALEGYGAAYTLREMLTIKSDDILGRSATFDSIIKNEKIRPPNSPASFNVLLNYLRGLAMDVDLKKSNNKE